jgi:hypothetical protein
MRIVPGRSRKQNDLKSELADVEGILVLAVENQWEPDPNPGDVMRPLELEIFFRTAKLCVSHFDQSSRYLGWRS